MANDKEIIKKLLAIATKQQKIITKLAMNKQAQDPLEGLDLSPPPASAPAPAPKPAAPVAGKPAPLAEKSKTAPAPDKDALDPKVKADLDSLNMPQLKGSLKLTPSGGGYRVDFNADRIKARPNDLKKALEKALNVTEILGHMNPAWKANY